MSPFNPGDELLHRISGKLFMPLCFCYQATQRCEQLAQHCTQQRISVVERRPYNCKSDTLPLCLYAARDAANSQNNLKGNSRLWKRCGLSSMILRVSSDNERKVSATSCVAQLSTMMTVSRVYFIITLTHNTYKNWCKAWY